MRFLSAEKARVTFFLPLDQMRPLGGVPTKDFIAKLFERYSFISVTPQLSRPWPEIENEPLRFFEGSFLLDGVSTSVMEFAVHSDGVFAVTYHSDHAERFLADLLGWSQSEFGMKEPPSEPRKLFVSTIIVEFEREITGLFKSFDELAALFGKYLQDTRDIDAPISVTKLLLGPDPTTTHRLSSPSDFVLERRINQPHATNQFYCDLPLPTDKAVELLRELEKMF